MPASRSASASSPPRPKTNGSPPLSRTTRLPGAGVLDQQRVASPPAGRRRRRPPCRRRRARRPPRAVERLGRDQAVVEDHVGRGEQLGARTVSRPGSPGPGADEVDDRRVIAAHASACGAASSRAAGGQQSRAGRQRPRGRLGLAAVALASSSRTHADPSAGPANAADRNASAVEPRVRADGRVATRAERPHDGALRRAGTPRSAVMDMAAAARAPASPARASSAITPWPGGGHEHARGRARRRASSRRPAARARRAASTIASNSPSASLRSRVSTLPRSSTTSRSSRTARSCARPAQRAGPDARALRAAPSSDARADERVARVGARRRRRRAPSPSGSSPGHVLGRVHGEVDLAREQRRLELPDPARLVAARAVDVAGGRDLDELGVGSGDRARPPRGPGRARARCRGSRSAARPSTAAAARGPRRARRAPRRLGPPASSSPNSSRRTCRRAWRCSASAASAAASARAAAG